MKDIVHYRVGGHILTTILDPESRQMLNMTPYEPFRVEQCSEQPLFTIEQVDSIDCADATPLIVDAPLSASGMPRVDVYETEKGFRYDIFNPRSTSPNAVIAVEAESHKVDLVLSGKAHEKNMAMTNAMILSYITFGMERDTLLFHSSTVMLEGKAYLFLGKSGTGKSTHSRMWLAAFDSAELLNDDHPIVRTHADGTVVAYGSPWSGKTPCYRNLSAPVGAIVRIDRALENQLEPLRTIKAFASLTTSCSGAQWSKKLMNDKVQSIEKVISNTPCYIMHCLPNEEAARVCHAGINK